MEHGDTPLDVAHVVEWFWSAPPEALFTQKDLAAVTGFSESYFERGRWAGYGPKFRKVGGKLVRYTKGDSASWINQNPPMASTSELPRPVVGAPRKPRKKQEPSGTTQRKARAGPKSPRRVSKETRSPRV
jgi:hypothetical protein